MSENNTSTKAWTIVANRMAYPFILFMLTLTGFAQMPIFKRYYIADIPGFGWLAAFFTTHYLHYLFAALFLGYAAYIATDHLLASRRCRSVTRGRWIKAALLIGVTGTGVALAIKNLPGAYFPPEAIIILDIAHLGLVVVFLAFTASALIAGKPGLFSKKGVKK